MERIRRRDEAAFAAVYDRWSNRLLDSQRAFVVPSSHAGRPNTRFAIVNPLTTFEDLVGILDTMQ